MKTCQERTVLCHSNLNLIISYQSYNIQNLVISYKFDSKSTIQSILELINFMNLILSHTIPDNIYHRVFKNNFSNLNIFSIFVIQVIKHCILLRREYSFLRFSTHNFRILSLSLSLSPSMVEIFQACLKLYRGSARNLSPFYVPTVVETDSIFDIRF